MKLTEPNLPLSPWERLKLRFIGRPLSIEHLAHERIPKWKALAVLSSDALSSVAYATEEVLIPLSLFTMAAVAWSIPIALAIVFLIFIITVSYRQTIDAYPGGGGAYTVAKENLGTTAGLVAGAALLIDYILTVAVSVSAGVENFASAFPILLPHKEIVGIFLIAMIAVFNLRGIKESASVFALPTYLFIVSFLVMIVAGFWHAVTGTIPVEAPILHEAYPAIPTFLLLRAFASGCSALTGIEAISNGIPIFKDPARDNAKATMTWMAVILGVLFLGMTVLSHLYGIMPKEGVTTVSLLSEKIFGRNLFYFVIQAATTLILVLAANTSYADFPRLSSLLAHDRFLPRQFASLGDRLVFSNGIIGLSLASILLIVVFGGDTHHLIPLYAVGVFLSFTLSQVGMVVHHWKEREKGWHHKIAFNLIGAVTTAVVLFVIGLTKFIHGAWVVVILIPLLVFLFKQIKAHYVNLGKQLRSDLRLTSGEVRELKHTAIVPISSLHPGTIEALRYAVSISRDVRAVFVDLDAEYTAKLSVEWDAFMPTVPLIVLPSPFRSVVRPILRYIDRVERETKDEVVTVIVPEFVTEKWYQRFLHNQTALILSSALKARREIVVTSVRHHLGQ